MSEEWKPCICTEGAAALVLESSAEGPPELWRVRCTYCGMVSTWATDMRSAQALWDDRQPSHHDRLRAVATERDRLRARVGDLEAGAAAINQLYEQASTERDALRRRVAELEARVAAAEGERDEQARVLEWIERGGPLPYTFVNSEPDKWRVQSGGGAGNRLPEAESFRYFQWAHEAHVEGRTWPTFNAAILAMVEACHTPKGDEARVEPGEALG